MQCRLPAPLRRAALLACAARHAVLRRIGQSADCTGRLGAEACPPVCDDVIHQKGVEQHLNALANLPGCRLKDGLALLRTYHAGVRSLQQQLLYDMRQKSHGSHKGDAQEVVPALLMQVLDDFLWLQQEGMVKG